MRHISMRKIRILVIIAVMWMFCFCVPSNAGSVTESQVNSDLKKYIDQYEGTRWTSSYYGAIQCKGFATMIFDKIFDLGGSTIGTGSVSSNSTNYILDNLNSTVFKIGTVYNGSLDDYKSLLSKARPGDFLQMRRRSSGGPHSMIVVSVSDSKVDIFDCNTDGNCTVKHYDQTFSTFKEKNIGFSLYRSKNYSDAAFSVNGLKRTIPNGLYRIKLRGTSYSLAVKGSSTSSGAKIQLFTDSETSASEWFYINYIGAGYYSIIGKASNLALTADGVSQGSTLSIQSYAGKDAQLWAIYTADGVNNFYLIPKSAINSDKSVKGVVDVKDGKAQDNQVVQIWTPNSTAAQMFHLTPGKTLSNGVYYIKSKLSSSAYSLSVKANSTSSGANIHLWNHSDSNKFQRWKITHVMSGRYTIVNDGSGLGLEVKGAETSSGTNVQQAPPDSSKNEQLWQITLDDSGNYAFRPYVSPECVLTVEGNTAEDGANVNISATENKVGQRFGIERYVAPSSITLDRTSGSIWEGQTLALKATLLPTNVTVSGIKWTSSNTGVATVDQNGKVTGVSAGTAVITAASVDNVSVKGTCTITVSSTVKPAIPTGRTIEDGVYQIRKQGTNYNLSVANRSREAGALLCISASGAEDETTEFRVTYEENGYYTITNVDSGFLVDTLGGKTDAGTAIQQWKNNGSNAQKWYIAENTNGSYYIIPKHATNRAIDLIGNKDEEGNGLQLYYIHTGTGQRFTFIPIEKSVTGVNIDQTQITLNEGDSFKLNAIVEPEGANNKTVTWESTEPGIAEVAQDGTVKAISKGNTIITVRTEDGNKIDECKVSVINPIVTVTGVSLDREALNLDVGESADLTVEVTPDDATNKQIYWTSSDNSVARVDAYGHVTAVTIGEAIITAEASDRSNGEQKIECVVTVKRHATGLILSEHELMIKKGESGTLQAEVKPTGATDVAVKWNVNGDAVTIDQKGNFIAKKSGEAKITATIEGTELKDECVIRVIQLAEDVLINMREVTLKEGEKKQITATVLPEETTNKNLVWSSSNEEVAIVDDTGLVSGIKHGESTIIVVDKDSGITAECVVEVVLPVTDISFEYQELSMEVDEVIQLTPIIIPEEATNKNIEWISSNNTILSVDNNGKVAALNCGEASITAVSKDSGVTATCDITVIYKVSDISLSRNEIEIEAGKTYSLKAEISPQQASNKSVVWKSSDDNIASVNENGVVTGVSSGETYVTVTSEDGGKYASCKVVVRKSTISGCRIVFEDSLQVYDGTPKTPAVSVFDDNLQLTQGVNFEVSYEENVYAGIGTVVITGIGNYEGLTRKGFTIKKAVNNIVALDIVCKSSAENETTQKITAKATGGVISYSSEKTDLHISGDGMITIPVNYEGETTVTIIAEDNNYEKAQTTIDVKITRQEISDQTIADAVIAKINEIGEVTYNDACKARIDAARAAYNSLSDAQKALVTNYGTLTAAESKYTELKTAAEQSAANQSAANAVIAKINEIGEVAYNDACKARIDAARAAYNSLSDAQKALVANYGTLTAAEEMFTNSQLTPVKEWDPITIAKTPSSVKVKVKKNKVTVSWKKIKKSKKTKKLLSQIKRIQIQISTDPEFNQIVIDKMISKSKTKIMLKLRNKMVYYTRVRYVGVDGVSQWSSKKKVKTKK